MSLLEMPLSAHSHPYLLYRIHLLGWASSLDASGVGPRRAREVPDLGGGVTHPVAQSTDIPDDELEVTLPARSRRASFPAPSTCS